jgi:hypothetical protein
MPKLSSPYTVKILGEVREIPPKTKADPLIFLPVWEKVDNAPVGVWIKVDLEKANRAMKFKKRAEIRGFLAERRKNIVYVKRNSIVTKKVDYKIKWEV